MSRVSVTARLADGKKSRARDQRHLAAVKGDHKSKRHDSAQQNHRRQCDDKTASDKTSSAASPTHDLKGSRRIPASPEYCSAEIQNERSDCRDHAKITENAGVESRGGLEGRCAGQSPAGLAVRVDVAFKRGASFAIDRGEPLNCIARRDMIACLRQRLNVARRFGETHGADICGGAF